MINNKLQDSLSSMVRILTVVLILAVLLLGVYVIKGIQELNYVGQDVSHRNTIQVGGNAEGYYAPDLAKITFAVSSEKQTVTEVMKTNSQKMNAVIKHLKKEQNIADEDIRTTIFDLHPRYEYYDNEEESGKRVLVGYELIQGVETKVRDLDKIGTIISGATEAGANEVSNLNFLIEDEKQIRQELRQQAITEAKEKANVLATQLGVGLGSIVNFSEPTYPIYRESVKRTPLGMGEEEVPSIAPGANKMTSRVVITYSIN